MFSFFLLSYHWFVTVSFYSRAGSPGTEKDDYIEFIQEVPDLPSKHQTFNSFKSCCFVFCLLHVPYHFFALRYHTKYFTLGSSYAMAPECRFASKSLG